MKFATLKAQVVTLRAALEAVEASIAIEEAKRAAKKSGAPTLPASPEASDGEASVASEKPTRARKPRDPNSPYAKLQAAVKVLYADVSAEDRKALTANGFGYLVLCGYLKKLDKETLTADDMTAAVAYLKANPEYKSSAQIQRSAKASVASGEKSSTINTEVDKIMEEITSDNGSVAGSDEERWARRCRPLADKKGRPLPK
jgi:hypothetical protein